MVKEVSGKLLKYDEMTPTFYLVVMTEFDSL